MSMRIFHAAGNANVISAHQAWARGEHYDNEVSITFSSQVEQACRDLDAEVYILGCPREPGLLKDGNFTVEHKPKPFPGASGICWHLAELWHGVTMLRRAVRFRADWAVIDSGCTHFFWLTWFRLFGIRVIPVLHTTLWPKGFPPTKLSWKIVTWLDRWFWRNVPYETIGVSPECERQVRELSGDKCRPIRQIRAQFHPEYFARIPPAPSPESGSGPFRILFIGRVTHTKGVFDILEMAAKLEQLKPGRVRFEICGRGPDFDRLCAKHKEMKLDEIVTIHGWVSLDRLVEIYTRCHASIVPTTSGFAEGMAMTAAESVHCGRPVITSQVVPALEVIRAAAVEARTDDVDSYVEQISRLIDDPDRYREMVKACPESGKPFYDRSFGLTAVLKSILTGAGDNGRMRTTSAIAGSPANLGSSHELPGRIV